LLGAVERGAGTLCGWIRLQLSDGNGQTLQSNGRAPAIPLFGNAPLDELELACTLQPQRGNTTAPTQAQRFTFVNLNHALQSQLAEGGLTLGFHVVEDDGAFPVFATYAAHRYHMVTVAPNGQLVIGSSPFGGNNGIGEGTRGLDDILAAM